MSAENGNRRVWDYRTDLRNVVVSPEIRARFLRMEPGEVGPFHAHDVGSEVFIVLEGTAEFLLGEERVVVGPGQMCFTPPGERHEVRVVGDEPMTLFLAVTPHLDPTHTYPTATGDEPRVGTWRVAGLADWSPADPAPNLSYQAALADAADALDLLAEASAPHESGAEWDAATVAEVWPAMRTFALAISGLTEAWNRLALRSLPDDPA